ncbi:MAG: FG-GAP repeat protein [Scytonematopsis contorta HA4267-MV1]|jgi:hypothetical protein|nr:FG-GAP repeat protein [Scytonematopsis contorta HA4267-MV1]
MATPLSNAPNLELSQSPTNFSINNSSTVIAPGLQILSLNNTASSLPKAQVSITNYTSSSTESLSVVGAAVGATSGTIGSTAITWNYASGVITLTGSASYSDYQTALRQITYNNTSPILNTTRDIRFTLGDLAINAAGDRAYKFVASPSNSWGNANSAATTDNYFGSRGYLATITSQVENDIVQSLLISPQVNAWIGGSDRGTEGQWRWVTGPEGEASSGSGTLFYQNGTTDTNSATGSWSPATSTPGYSNWFNSEPNNFNNDEDYAYIMGNSAFSSAEQGKWSDGPTVNNLGGQYGADGYIVEYGGLTGQPILKLAGITTINFTNPISTIVGGSNITLRNYNSGENAIWQLNGATLTAANLITPVTDKNWVMVASADFNGDGKDDLLWRNYNNGENAIWLKDGNNLNSFSSAGAKFITQVADTSWKMITAADFNGDGKADILWRNSRSGENAIWFMDASVVTNDGRYVSNSQFFTNSLRFIDTNWEMVGAGNFDADNKADIVWRNKVTGENAIWLMDGITGSSVVDGSVGTPVASKAGGTRFIETVADTDWKIVGIGDFDGDNKSDLVWRNNRTGENAIWTVDTTQTNPAGNFLTNGQFILDRTTGVKAIADGGWRIEAVGDTNSDGKSDLIWRNYSLGVDSDKEAVWQMSGNVSNGGRYVTIANGNTALTGDLNWDIVDSHIA